MFFLAIALTVLPIMSTGCGDRPITVETIQQEAPSNGIKLLRSTIVIQDAISSGVSTKALTPEKGIEYLEFTKQIGVAGHTVATNLDKLDIIVKAGKTDGPLITEILSGLDAMSQQYPKLIPAGIPTQVATAVSEAQKLIATLKSMVEKLRTPTPVVVAPVK